MLQLCFGDFVYINFPPKLFVLRPILNVFVTINEYLMLTFALQVIEGGVVPDVDLSETRF
jgi:hypothetical protein